MRRRSSGPTSTSSWVARRCLPARTRCGPRRTPGGYRLVFNMQVGQWGTMYDPKRDLVRVPLRESSVTAPAERFIIAVQPEGARAVCSP